MPTSPPSLVPPSCSLPQPYPASSTPISKPARTPTIEQICGDGIVDPDEECDRGPANADNAACTQFCEAAYCGDGLVHAGVEGCDDANTENYDGCSNRCEPLFHDNFADGVDPRWQLLGTPDWAWMQHYGGGFMEVTLAQPQSAGMSLAFELSSDGVVRFDKRILDEGLDLTLTIDGNSVLSDDTDTAASLHHEFPLSAGHHSFLWTATAMTGDGTVRLDNVYIDPQNP